MKIKNIIIILSIFVIFLSTASYVFSQDWDPVRVPDSDVNMKIIRSYKNYTEVINQNILVPKIVQIDFKLNDVTNNLFAVYNITDRTFVPYVFISDNIKPLKITYATETFSSKNLYNLFDSNSNTFQDFYLNNTGESNIEINVQFVENIKTNSFNLVLDNYVAMPTAITVKAIVGNSEIVLLNKYKPTSNIIKFPETIAKQWVVQLSYNQMIRISEISFNNLFDTTSKKSIRFLMSPNEDYRVYLNPESFVDNYADNEKLLNAYGTDILSLGFYQTLNNPDYSPSDSDKDGIPDSKDNCKSVYNPNQIDIDGNGIGDDCDDYDKDGIMNISDNCLDKQNYNQLDTDGDGLGDLCDSDESRITEKFPWIVWLGIGFAFLIFVILLFIANKRMKENNSIVPPPTSPQI